VDQDLLEQINPRRCGLEPQGIGELESYSSELASRLRVLAGRLVCGRTVPERYRYVIETLVLVAVAVRDLSPENDRALPREALGHTSSGQPALEGLIRSAYTLGRETIRQSAWR